MDILSTDEIKTYLKLEGISTDLTDTELTELQGIVFDLLNSELDGLLKTKTVEEVIKVGYEDIVLSYYPVSQILEHNLNYTNLEDYLDKENGIIYLPKPFHGLLRIKYESSLPTTVITETVKPLILMMIANNISYGWDLEASSIREGDIQVSYDTSNGNISRVQNMIDKLKGMYACRVEMI